MRPLKSIRFAAVVTLGLSALVACVPKRDLPPDQIEKLGKLKEVMDVQATVADRELKKIGQTAFSDADWAEFADTGNRIQVTSRKIHEFSKGPQFDQLADRLHASAEALSAAAVAKDAVAAPGALAEMKATCKTCHAKFK